MKENNDNELRLFDENVNIDFDTKRTLNQEDNENDTKESNK